MFNVKNTCIICIIYTKIRFDCPNGSSMYHLIHIKLYTTFPNGAYMLWPVWTLDPGQTFLSRLAAFWPGSNFEKSGFMGWIELDPGQFFVPFRRWFSEIDPGRANFLTRVRYLKFQKNLSKKNCNKDLKKRNFRYLKNCALCFVSLLVIFWCLQICEWFF